MSKVPSEIVIKLVGLGPDRLIASIPVHGDSVQAERLAGAMIGFAEIILSSPVSADEAFGAACQRAWMNSLASRVAALEGTWEVVRRVTVRVEALEAAHDFPLPKKAVDAS